MLDVPHELVEHASWLLHARRREQGTRWRLLGCFQQALLALVHLRKNETFAQLGAGFGVSEATAWRYTDEVVDVLIAWAPGLHEALVGLGEGDFVIVDGTLIPTDRPDPGRRAVLLDETSPTWHECAGHRPARRDAPVVLPGAARPDPRPDRSLCPRHRPGLPDQAGTRPWLTGPTRALAPRSEPPTTTTTASSRSTTKRSTETTPACAYPANEPSPS